MKADHLNRKTHLKRHARLPVQDAAVQGFENGADDLVCHQAATQHDIILTDLRHDEERITPTHDFTTEDDILAWCFAIMSESPTACRLLQNAQAQGWTVAMTDLHNGGYHIDIPARCLTLDHFSMKPDALGRSPYFRNALLCTFVRALRDIWQEQIYGGFEKDYSPEHVLMLERVRAADGDTVTIMAGWELRGAGHTEVWRHILGSEEGDMALVFTRFLERDPGAMFDGTALAYAFRQWFADQSRVDSSDHDTLEALDDVFLDADSQPFGDRSLDPALIEALSILPDGICYLAGLGHTVMSDPFFAGLNDPINQTHLFHIMYDMEVTMVNNVPFRDDKLARKIFPDGIFVKNWR